jgi:hypothetical protein
LSGRKAALFGIVGRHLIDRIVLEAKKDKLNLRIFLFLSQLITSLFGVRPIETLVKLG